MTDENDLKCPEGNRDNPLDKIESGKYRARALVFTSFDDNPVIVGDGGMLDNQVKYLIQGKENCPSTGKQHWQCYVYFFEKVSIKVAKKKLKIKKGWFQYAYGTHKENVDYCSKNGDIIEWGTAPQQGKRTDLEELRDKILKGETSLKDIRAEHPYQYHQYGRTLTALEDDVLTNKKRTKMTKGYWFYGETGTGKTHEFFKNILKEEEDYYVWCLGSTFQCGYKHQRCVLIDDFRGELTIGMLCKIVDKWNSCKIERKCRESINFTSEVVVITSSMHPADLYQKANIHDKLDQIYRRFEVKHFKNRFYK